MTGRLHSCETFGAADGPGVRFIAFLHGCAFRCAYCHNPDSWAAPAAEETTAAELLERALRYRSYWGERGGVTVSGGEPLLQPEFTAEFFRLAHQRGINTCLDTAAGPFQRTAPFTALFDETDVVLLDLKHLDPAAHRKLTGHDNAAVLDCARYLAETGKRTWIRHVLVPGVTDDPAHLEKLGAFIRTLPNVERVDVLPYHTMGAAKWERLGIAYPLAGTPTPDDAALETARRLLYPANVRLAGEHRNAADQ